jgi:GTP pyrophosphokinase
VGHHCSGARCNGQIVPIRYKMKNGDVLEIMTSPSQRPSKDWLDFCVTTRGRTRIRAFLRAEKRIKSINLGRELLDAEMRGAGMSMNKLLKNEDESGRLAASLHFGSVDELLLSIGYGKLNSEDVITALQARPKAETEVLKPGAIESIVRRVTGAAEGGGIKVSGIDDVLIRYAKCCNPLPGDAIIGFITRGRGVTVHRRECNKAFDTDPERRIDVSWDSKAKINRPVQISVTTTNKPGLLATVSQTLSAHRINISEANCRAGDDGRAHNTFTFHCSDLSQLKNVMKAISKLSGVVEVARV